MKCDAINIYNLFYYYEQYVNTNYKKLMLITHGLQFLISRSYRFR